MAELVTFPPMLRDRIRTGRWSEQQVRHLGLAVVGFVQTIELPDDVRSAVDGVCLALESGDVGRLRSADAAAEATAYTTNDAAADAIARAAAAATADVAYAYYSAVADAAAAADATADVTTIRQAFDLMVARIMLIVG